MKTFTLSNRHVSLTADALGRIVSLRNRVTRTELIARRDVCEAWRIVVPTGPHTLGFLLGTQQRPPRIERSADGLTLTIRHASLRLGRRVLKIRATFTITLSPDSSVITCSAGIENRDRVAVDEVEFPVIGGLGGFPTRQGRRELNLTGFGLYRLEPLGRHYGDVLHRALPETGSESHHFVREHETAMFPVTLAPTTGAEIAHHGLWLDLHHARQGLYAGLHDRKSNFAFKLEKYPKEFFHGGRSTWPRNTRRWLRLYGLHMPQVAPGSNWKSPPVTLLPHAGDWHAGADLYRAWRMRGVTFCRTPSWMRDFTGWTEVSCNFYTGEVFHTYRRVAERVIADSKVTGSKFVYLYGSSRLGAEGADFDNGPSEELGGERDFRRMIAAFHRHGIRVMLLDQIHRWVNHGLPEYRRLGLERYAVRQRNGSLVTSRWWKETGLSCLYQRGPTPEWVEMCPSCPGWRAHYFRHIEQMIRLGADAVELDVFLTSPCFSKDHPHKPGADMDQTKLDFIREARVRAKRLNPEFAFFGETMLPEARTVLDGFYTYRHLDEHGSIHRYLFPEIREQTALAGNHCYDQVNKALQYGIGNDTEIWGLRTTTLDGCPELARYLGRVNRFRRKFSSVMMHGTFRDTVGGTVKGNVAWSVIEGANGGRALVLRNNTDQAQKVRAKLDGSRPGKLSLWTPRGGERKLARLPASLKLGIASVAVVVADA